jgi:hypothetical protein
MPLLCEPNMKKTLLIGLIAGIITVAMIPSLTFSVTNAFAAAGCDDPPCGDRSDNANHFGKGASDAGKAGKMGDHASGQTEPRKGIGNLGFPGDVADSLGPIP